MPVVTLYLQRLQGLVGGKSSRDRIIDALPFLGLDIEEQTNEYVRVEYSPNRPDYATDVGIASGLQGLLGIKKGIDVLRVKKAQSKQLAILVDPAVRKIRPYVSGIIARGGRLDDEAIRQIIALQEDLHFGIGRRRRKSSIGIHDLDAVSLPLKYTAKSNDHKFVPLVASDEMSVQQILEQTDVGRDYGKILDKSQKVPMIVDSNGSTVSFPPIINSALTTVSSKTRNILVEVTGNDKNAVDDSLSVVAAALGSLGFALHELRVGSTGTAQIFRTRSMTVDPGMINQMLGLSLSASQICQSLRKCRLDAAVKGKKITCTIPRFRFDILGPMDLVEEVALGYGIQKLSPTLPSSSSVGHKNPVTLKVDKIGQIMIGLGFLEALNSSLTSKQTLYDHTGRSSGRIIEVAESKSQEHTVLRDLLLPGLLENLSRNVHEPYPQKLFETGTVFSEDSPIGESLHIACVSAHKDVGFTEIKSVLQSMLKTFCNIECKTKTSEVPMFANGKTADVIIGGKKVGMIGEIDPQVIENFKVRVPVSGFEMTLSGVVL